MATTVLGHQLTSCENALYSPFARLVVSLPTKHIGVHMNSFKRVRAFQIELEFGSVGFWGEGKTGVPGEKPLGARERTSNKLNPHMASTPGAEPGPHWWEASALTTAQPLLPKISFLWVYQAVECFLRVSKLRENVGRLETNTHFYAPAVVACEQALSGALWRRGGKRKETLQLCLWKLKSSSNFPVTPRRLSCKISANQRAAERARI